MNSRVGRLGGHSHDSRNLTFLFRSREATTHRVYLNEVDTPLHLNLMTRVPRTDGGWEIVRVELQLRTLLQDSWGELTHEDTYKPGVEVSELVATLSGRMADIFAVMDRLAQDLRNELDTKLAAAVGDLPEPVALSEEPSSLNEEQKPADETSYSDSQLLEAVKEFVEKRYDSLIEPLYLASFAWELQREFGSEITDGWLGFGKMANLLSEVVPDDSIITGVPGLLIPRGMDHSVVAGAVKGTLQRPADIPEIAVELRRYDAQFPLLSAKDLSGAYSVLAAVHNDSRASYGKPDLRYLNAVTRSARDRSQKTECPISRSVLNYIGVGYPFDSGSHKMLWSRESIYQEANPEVTALARRGAA